MSMKETCPPWEIGFVAIGFALSLIHSLVCAAYFLLLLLLLRQRIVGCLKGLLIVTTRGILSAAIGAEVSGLASTVKWILIFVFSFYILFSQKQEQTDYNQLKCHNTLFLLVGLFAIYSVIASLITGSYPVISAFKIISYSIPFLAVIMGVSLTNHQVDWAEYCYLLLSPVIVISAIVIPFGSFKVVNDSFQGIINHPNLFGIFGAIYLCFLLYSNYSFRKTGGLDWKRIVLMVLTFVMIYLSASRTGLFSAIVILLMYFITMNAESKIKLIAGLAIFAVIIAIYFAVDNNAYQGFVDEINHFIMKRENAESVLDTREQLMEASMNKFRANPLFGSGFGVGYTPSIKSFEFSMEMTYESGNLYTTLLGDTGVLGLAFFALYMGYILLQTKPKKWMLFIAPIIISLGEMAFFSTNNIAIYYFVMLGICICKTEEDTQSAVEYHSTGIQRRTIS